MNGIQAMAMLTAVMGFATGVAAQAPDWVSLTTTGTPAVRSDHVVCYFENANGQGRILMHGGSVGATTTNETFLLDSRTGAWSNIATAAAPSARWDKAMSFDRNRNRAVLFGGQFGTTLLDDTWEFTGTDWVQATPSTRPAARRFHAMSYDAVRGVTVLFGGEAGNTRFSDTWEWNGATWVPRTSATVPAVLQSLVMAFDSVRGVTVLVGRTLQAGNPAQTWEWNGTNWTQRANAPISGAGFAFDAARQRCVMLNSDTQQTAEWDGTNWTTPATMNTPPLATSTNQYLAYDENMGRTVFAHGGFAGTWLFGSPTPARLVGFGTGCPGTGGYLLRLRGQTAMELPKVGTSLDLFAVTGVLGSPLVALTLGTGSAAIDLTGIGAPGCFSWATGDLGSLSTIATAGVAPFTLIIPNNPPLIGLSLFIQAAALDATANALGGVTSAGRELVVGN